MVMVFLHGSIKILDLLEHLEQVEVRVQVERQEVQEHLDQVVRQAHLVVVEVLVRPDLVELPGLQVLLVLPARLE
jgi:hypothetical protein